jgi:hypothetical protein
MGDCHSNRRMLPLPRPAELLAGLALLVALAALVLALVALCQPAPRCVIPPYACPMIAQSNGLPFRCSPPPPVCGSGYAYANDAGVVKSGPPVQGGSGSSSTGTVVNPGGVMVPAPSSSPAR